MKIKKSYIHAGVFIDEHNSLQMNTKKDNIHRDIILLNRKSNGSFTDNGVQYIYSYSYNEDCTDKTQKQRFRDHLKNPTMAESKLWDDFVELGVLNIGTYTDINKFSAIVCTQSKPHSLVSRVHTYLLEHISHNLIDFELIKKLYRDVKFDYNAAFSAMLSAGYSRTVAKNEIDKALEQFEELKKSNKLFQMKKFLPRELRSGFYDFLKFKTEEERDAYLSLQGVEVLVFDDLYTSGSTIKEIIRYLNSINPNNKVTVFVMVKQ